MTVNQTFNTFELFSDGQEEWIKKYKKIIGNGGSGGNKGGNSKYIEIASEYLSKINLIDEQTHNITKKKHQ